MPAGSLSVTRSRAGDGRSGTGAPQHRARLLRFTIVGLSVLALFPPAPLRAQWVGDPANEERLRNGIRLVYNLSFDSARAEFLAVQRARPDHPAGYFFLAMVSWWKIVSDLTNTSHDDRFLAELDRVIDLCDKRLEKDENDLAALFFKGGALGFQGRLHGNRDDWIKAANAGREALPIVRKAYALSPGNHDILMGMGIYNYYAAVVPELYPIVKPLMIFFPKGDKARGLEQLRTASDHARYAGVEASYFLMLALQNIERRHSEALPIALRLHREFPRNGIFHKYVGRCQAALGNWGEMRNVFAEVLELASEHRVGYDVVAEREAEYYLGLYEMQAERNEEALRHFYRSDELSRSLDIKELSGFMTVTNLRIGMIYDLQGKRKLAVEQYHKVLKMKDFLDAHRQAEEYLATPYKRS